ncbi:MAG: ABC transporter permease [Candidatus Marinimicrobia bacterium]|nr:ABC transporter permease [Candidatus Neomarinimicrobiota bacterium]
MFPEHFTISISSIITDGVDVFVATYGSTFRAFSDVVLFFLLQIEQILRGAPWWLVVLVVGFLGFILARRILFSVGLMSATLLLGVLGLWDQAMQTLSLMISALVFAAALGIPFGVILARFKRLRLVFLPILDAMQTLPSFVYLVPALMLFGLGKVPALIATIIYAVPPVARLTDLGLRHADAEAVEAANAFGATPQQRLWWVELPLALPSIMAGLNQATMMALSMVVVASMIGARGLGEEVLLGIQRLDTGRGIVAGTAIVVLAIVLDRLTQASMRRLQRTPQSSV